MRLWCWRDGERVDITRDSFSAHRPVLIVCPGALQVEPEAAATAFSEELDRLFAIIAAVEGFQAAERLRNDFLGSQLLSQELDLNYAITRKLLRAGGDSDDIKVLQVSYSDANENLLALKASHEDVKHISEDARSFVDLVFSRLIEGGDVDVISRRFELITLFGVSYGSAFCLQVENALHERLLRDGFSERACKEIMPLVASICVSNVSNMRASGSSPRFTSVYFEAVNDVIGEHFNPNRFSLSADEKISLVQVSLTKVMFVVRLPTHIDEWIEVLPGIDYSEIANNRGCHFIPFFTMRSKPDAGVAGLVETALCGAARRHALRGWTLRHFLPAQLARGFSEQRHWSE